MVLPWDFLEPEPPVASNLEGDITETQTLEWHEVKIKKVLKCISLHPPRLA